jgi:hypothetical protein
MVTPDTRTVVTWTASDNASPPNQTTDTQLVTVKTPGTNTAPSAIPRTADTRTSQPVDIVLSGLDTDELPYTGGVPAGLVADPLQFKIEQRPSHGEFVAPLFPYFIDDYRTDKNNTLIDYIKSQPNSAQLMAQYTAALGPMAAVSAVSQLTSFASINRKLHRLISFSIRCSFTLPTLASNIFSITILSVTPTARVAPPRNSGSESLIGIKMACL